MGTAIIPGGYYLNSDGTKAHDANGKEIPLIKAKPEPVEVAPEVKPEPVVEKKAK